MLRIIKYQIEFALRYGVTKMTLREKTAIIDPLLTEYQYQCLYDCYDGFGFNEETLDTLLYVWFGMESDAFIDTYCKG